MPFENFTNPFPTPAQVPEKYRERLELRALFQPGGTYKNAAEDPVTMWAISVLHEDYGVPIDVMRLEVSFNPAQSAQKTAHAWTHARVDLVVLDDRYLHGGNGLDVAFIAL